MKTTTCYLGFVGGIVLGLIWMRLITLAVESGVATYIIATVGPLAPFIVFVSAVVILGTLNFIVGLIKSRK